MWWAGQWRLGLLWEETKHLQGHSSVKNWHVEDFPWQVSNRTFANPTFPSLAWGKNQGMAYCTSAEASKQLLVLEGKCYQRLALCWHPAVNAAELLHYPSTPYLVAPGWPLWPGSAHPAPALHSKGDTTSISSHASYISEGLAMAQLTQDEPEGRCVPKPQWYICYFTVVPIFPIWFTRKKRILDTFHHGIVNEMKLFLISSVPC